MIAQLKKVFIEKNDTIVEFAGLVVVFGIFISGVGPYRVILVYAIYLFFKVILSLTPFKGNKVTAFIIPASIIALYYDIADGSIWYSHVKTHLIVALPLMVIADTLTRHYMKRFISYISNGTLFISCPSCNFDNRELVRCCNECSYIKGEETLRIPREITPNLIPLKIFRMLGVSTDEELLFHKRISRNMAIFKNGRRIIRKHLVITVNNVIFIDYHFYSKSCRERDTIPISMIVNLRAGLRKIYLSKKPFIEFQTSNTDKYEIIFSSFGRYEREIEMISKHLLKINPHVNAGINLGEQRRSWRDEWKI